MESFPTILALQRLVRPVFRCLVLVVILGCASWTGCYRAYYRHQADTEARCLIQEKTLDPRWNSITGDIDIDPMSRMFDPFCPDHPPLPPDDPTSHQLMHVVDGKAGYPCWHQNGDTQEVENPVWKSYLPVNDHHQVVLTLDRAYQLALLHSPELQQQKETLYLSALDVSLERFGFDSQLFAGFQSFFTTQGRFRSGTGQSRTFISTAFGADGGGNRLRRLGVTGTNLVVGLANSILFNFSGPNTQSSTSLINFSIIQPLLRNAGRERILESLTLAERTLLANVRQMERFQRGFFLQIATGRNPGSGPARNNTSLAAPGNANLTPGGYLGLLVQQQQIRNLEFNVRQLESVLEQFREFFLRERLDAVQLKLFESNVYSQQAALLNAKIRYQTAVDQFKRTLGLPPDLEVLIQDDFLQPFELISDQLNERSFEISRLRDTMGQALTQIGALLPAQPPEKDTHDFSWSPSLEKQIEALQPQIREARKTLAAIEHDDLLLLSKDLDKLGNVRKQRVAYLEKLQQSIASGKIVSDVDPLLYDPESIPTRQHLQKGLNDPTNPQCVVRRIARLDEQFQATESFIKTLKKEQADWDSQQLYQQIVEQLQQAIPELFSEMNNIVLELTLIQARARSNSIEIVEVDLDSDQATEIARAFRRDWMNARAALVDRWRQIEFVADQLESQLDLVFEGDIRNQGNNPVQFRLGAGQLRAGFRFDAPIVRLRERNQYRQTLIAYQQARRQFYRFEDQIQLNLRSILRNLNRDQVLFELNRRSIQVQIEQIEINRLSLEAPVDPKNPSSRLGTSTARNLADAIIGLNQAQNRFMGTWVEYEILRRNLDFDLGTMQLDPEIGWQDPGPIDATIGIRAAASMGIELDHFWDDSGGDSEINNLPPMPELEP